MKEKYEKMIQRIQKDALKQGFTEEEIKSASLAGFSKLTSSARIMRLVEMAYYRGMQRGVKMVDEAETPIVLRHSEGME